MKNHHERGDQPAGKGRYNLPRLIHLISPAGLIQYIYWAISDSKGSFSMGQGQVALSGKTHMRQKSPGRTSVAPGVFFLGQKQWKNR